VASFFIFILVCNLTGLIPGIGSIGYGVPDKGSSMPMALKHVTEPFFRPPTSDANMTVALALCFFVASSWWALKYNGPVGLFKHIFAPKGGMKGAAFAILVPIFAAVGVIEVISILIRPVALSMRLYGNVYGGESVMTLMLNQAWGLPAIPFYFFELMVGVVQALVFTVLSIAFISTLCSHSEDEGGHGKETGKGGH
jgi:F-type H+-transporting ATPase subunit a